MNAAPSSAAFANGLSFGYGVRVTMFDLGYDFVLVVFLVSVSVSTFGCVFGFGFGSVLLSCCLLLVACVRSWFTVFSFRIRLLP